MTLRLGWVASAAVTMVIMAVATSGAAASAKGYDDCGQLAITPGKTTKILKTQRMSCGGAQDIARKFERALFSGALEIGDVRDVKRFRCKLASFYSPFELAYKCRHTRQNGKAFKAFYPPETDARLN